jgi:3-phosphoshikimate 1-carboxyvinyltransferase
LTTVSGKPAILVEVPGSKSLTQRALVAAALARGRSVIRRALIAEDTQYLMDA